MIAASQEIEFTEESTALYRLYDTVGGQRTADSRSAQRWAQRAAVLTAEYRRAVPRLLPG